jgi:hypothetical protein
MLGGRKYIADAFAGQGCSERRFPSCRGQIKTKTRRAAGASFGKDDD